MLVLDGANNALGCPVHSLGWRDVLIAVWLLPMLASPASQNYNGYWRFAFSVVGLSCTSNFNHHHHHHHHEFKAFNSLSVYEAGMGYGNKAKRRRESHS